MRGRSRCDRKWVSLLLLAGLLALQGCATVVPKPLRAPLREPLRDVLAHSLAGNYVYDRPIEQVWPEVRRLIKDFGYAPKEAADAFIIVTDWQEHMDGSVTAGFWNRYLVQGERLEADRCIIRFLKHEVVADASDYAENGVSMLVWREMNGYGRLQQIVSTEKQWGARDLKMEWLLLERIRPDIARQIMAEADRRISDGETAPVSLEEPAAPAGSSSAAPVASAGSAPPAAPASPPPAAPPPPAAGESAPVAAAPPVPAGPCGEEIPGAGPLLQPGGLLLLGEMHGSREIPAFAVTLACLAATRGLPVTLGLELPADAQPALEHYLEGGGSQQDVARLLAHAFWHRMYQDGRSSQAILEQIERVRGLRARKLPISLLAYDAKGQGGNPRQEAMARRILEARARTPKALFLVLSGNVQARTARGTEWDPDMVPMGARLLAVEPGLKALDAQYSGGTAWTCKTAGGSKLDCGSALAPAPQRTRILGQGLASDRLARGFERYRTYVRLDDALSPEGYHGIFYVGRLTASPPASPGPYDVY